MRKLSEFDSQFRQPKNPDHDLRRSNSPLLRAIHRPATQNILSFQPQSSTMQSPPRPSNPSPSRLSKEPHNPHFKTPRDSLLESRRPDRDRYDRYNYEPIHRSSNQRHYYQNQKELEIFAESETEEFMWGVMKLSAVIAIPSALLFSVLVAVTLVIFGSFSLFMKSNRAISLNLFLTLFLNYLLITIGVFLAIDVDTPDSVEMLSKLVFTLPVGWSLLLRIKEAALVPEMPRDRYNTFLSRWALTVYDTFRIFVRLKFVGVVLVAVGLEAGWKYLWEEPHPNPSYTLIHSTLTRLLILTLFSFTVNLSCHFNRYSYNAALSIYIRHQKIYLTLLRTRGCHIPSYKKLYFKIIKHLNQAYYHQTDYFQRELDIRSKMEEEDREGDVVMRWIGYYLQSILGGELVDEKQVVIECGVWRGSKVGVVKDLGVWWRKVWGWCRLEGQGVRVKAGLEMMEGVVGVLISFQGGREGKKVEDARKGVMLSLRKVYEYYVMIVDARDVKEERDTIQELSKAIKHLDVEYRVSDRDRSWEARRSRENLRESYRENMFEEDYDEQNAKEMREQIRRSQGFERQGSPTYGDRRGEREFERSQSQIQRERERERERQRQERQRERQRERQERYFQRQERQIERQRERQQLRQSQRFSRQPPPTPFPTQNSPFRISSQLHRLSKSPVRNQSLSPRANQREHRDSSNINQYVNSSSKRQSIR